MEKFAVIMAGGGGTRFWPLSRQNTPKQVLNISGNDVMINETIRRYEGAILLENSFIVTNQSQKRVLDGVLLPNVQRDNILAEPVGRNTAPCILYAAMHIYERFGDGIMCVFPSDHYITNIEGFRGVLQNAIKVAEDSEGLVTIGIKPSFPSTGYGYIKREKSENEWNAYNVSRFVEKPNLDVARVYVGSGDYYWNSGMFVWKVSVIINAFKRFLPRIYQKFEKISGKFGTPEGIRLLEEIYPELDSISVDYGIMERTSDAIVIPGDFGWNDVGSWDSLGAIFPPDENNNIVRAEHIGIDTKGCIIYGNEKLIATVGLENIVVVNTEDALMVCPKEKSQDVKKIVDLLKTLGKTELI